jgi:hypothetical protein
LWGSWKIELVGLGKQLANPMPHDGVCKSLVGCIHLECSDYDRIAGERASVATTDVRSFELGHTHTPHFRGMENRDAAITYRSRKI